jgi:hypothetical protein
MKYYKLKVPKTKKPEFRKPKPLEIREEEGLSGFIMGQRADSAYEERAYKSMKKNRNVTNIEYQPSYIAGRNMPGEIRLDFSAIAFGLLWPIQIDGTWTHKSAEQQEEDRVKDAILNNRLMGTGAQLVTRVPDYELKTQELSDRYFEEMF